MKTNKQRLWKIATAVLFLTVFITACKKDDFEGSSGVCPQVVSTTPANLAVNVPLDQVITVTFNERMNPETITSASFSLQATGDNLRMAISGTVTYNEANYTMSFTPDSVLMNNTTYFARVEPSVKDMMGNALQTAYLWSFSTGETVSPFVISTDPVSNATNVVLNKKVTATFNVRMDPSTFDATTFTLSEGQNSIGGTISYTDTTAFFTPSIYLLPNTLYTATITTGVKNIQGTSMPGNYTWTFTTGSIIAPEVILTDPADLATDVPLNKVISANFSELMDPSTVNSSNVLLMTGSNSVSGTVNYSGTTVTFTPTNNLLSGTAYTVIITTGVKNLAGVSLANNYVWNFNTVATLGPEFVELQSVERFGIIAGVGVSNNAGFSEIHNMDVGISPGVRSSITGFPPGIILNGAIYASDDIAPPGVPAMLTQAKQDLTDAYLFAEGSTSPAPAIVSGDLGGTTLAPGIYKSTSTLLIQSGNLTLDAQGDENAVWIFQIASDFTTVGGAGGNVILIGGAQSKNIFWQTGSSATIGNFTSFKGNVLALTSITMNSGATAEGRMLARNGSVILTNTNIIYKP